MQAPTYKEFRAFAFTHGYTGRKLAPHTEAGEPIETATRILVFLAGTRWDDEPLPYPKLCQLYHGESPDEKPERSTRDLRPFNQIPPIEAPDAPPLYRAWFNLFEEGWTLEKVADTWNQSLESVEAILGRLSRQPLLPDCVVLVLPRNEAQCTKRRQLLRELAQRGWPQESLLRITGCYTPEVPAEITRGAAPTSKVSARRKSRSKLDPKRFCPCGCKKRLKSRQKYASDACRKKVTRQRARIVA